MGWDVTCPTGQNTCSRGTPTWLGGVGPSSLGANAVIPSGTGVLDELSDVFEEFAERHLAGSIHSVVEEGGPPQKGVFSEQDAVNTCQPLLRGIVWLQLVFLTASPAVPRLLKVVNTTKIMSA